MTTPYLHLALDENPAVHSTTLVDTGSVGTNGTLSTGDGATNKSVAGKIGQGIQFDGVDDYIAITGSETAYDFNESSFTVMAWVKDVTGVGIVASKGGLGSQAGWALVISDTGFEVFLRRSDGGAAVDYSVGSQPFNNGSWHHVAAVIAFSTTVAGNNSALIYIDGAPVSGSNAGTGGTPSLNNNTMRWGVWEGDAGLQNYLPGKLDDLRIYTVALSAAEIAELAGTVYSATFGQLLASSGMVGRIYV